MDKNGCAILINETKMHLYVSPEILNECHGSSDFKTAIKSEFVVNAGALVKVFPLLRNEVHGSKKLSTVKVLDSIANISPTYEILYVCCQANLMHVDEQLWPYILSIEDPRQRLSKVQNYSFCNWLLNLKENDSVSLSGQIFNTPETNFNCIIRFIGPVPESNKRGYYFGLEFADTDSHSFYLKAFPHLYTQYNDSWLITTTAGLISPINKDEGRKCSAFNFVTGTIEKMKSAIGTADKKANENNTSSSAKFYHQIEDDNSKKNNMMKHDSEEYKQSIENREKSVARRTTNTAQTQTQPQSGILKTKHKDQTNPVRFTTDNKDIIIIDQNHINESLSQNNEVTIVNKTEGVDLQQILGNKWPQAANTILQKQDFENSTIPGGTDSKKLQNDSDGLSGFKNNSSSKNQTKSLKDVPNTEFSLGSVVEVNIPRSTKQLYGVIRWIGIPTGERNVMIGVELENDNFDTQVITGNGVRNGVLLFECPDGRAIFVTPDMCLIDSRFLGACGGSVDNGICKKNDFKTFSNGCYDVQQTFGNKECPVVPGSVAPIKCSSLNGLKELCGKFKGIQGHNNSCYLDVTLFSMFAFTPVFDAILYRPPEKEDISDYTEVQTVLREEIVNPLRKNMFVRADRVMKLRKLLDKLSSVSGLTSEEKDPEEFLNCLLSQIMRAEPFLKLNSGQNAYYYQLFVEKDDRLSFPSVQELFEQSFYTSDIKLKEVPSCLIIQMPRFGKNFKMYPRILPSQVLDVTDIIEDSPRQCTICGDLAEFECRDCFRFMQGDVGLECTSFCLKCVRKTHKHVKRESHKYRELSVTQDFRVMTEDTTVPRLYMELFAVVCIETSHYVAFVKTGADPDAPWCFFDSMADRKGELDGFNIPEIMTVPDLPQWLSDDGARKVNEFSSNDKMLPEHAKRLFCDAYMCMYQSTDVMMYR